MNPFHRHQWAPVATTPGEYALFGGMATAVLERCPCQKTRVRTISGWWTLKQLTDDAAQEHKGAAR